MLPHKRKPGKKSPMGEKLNHNKMVNSVRARAELAVARVKQYNRVGKLYSDTKEELGYDFCIAAGLANFHLM